MQHALCLAAAREGNHQHTGALAAGTARTAGTVQQGGLACRQVGVDHQIEVRQVDTACSNVSCHTHTGAAVLHCGQCAGALLLAEFAGKGHNGETAVREARCQPADSFTRRAEDDCLFRFMLAQHVDDGVFALVRGNRMRDVVDIAVLFASVDGRQANGILLEALGEFCNRLRNRC